MSATTGHRVRPSPGRLVRVLAPPPGRASARHRKTFKGVLQADAYAGFNKLYEDGTILQAPCLAHIRRKFYDLVEAQRSPVATEAVRRIGELYAIEREIRGRSPDIRQQVRQARAKPLLDSMRDWMEQSLASLSRKSDAAAAIRYARTLWDALTRYADDGIVEIDNSAAEPALRVVALGRKNSLFAGSDRRGERAAAVYALIGTATLDGIAPRKSNCGITTQNALDADSLPHLADLIDCGEIAIGNLAPVGGVATAVDGSN